MSQQKFKGSKIETVSFKRIFINSVVPNAPLLYTLTLLSGGRESVDLEQMG